MQAWLETRVYTRTRLSNPRPGTGAPRHLNDQRASPTRQTVTGPGPERLLSVFDPINRATTAITAFAHGLAPVY